MENVVPFMYRYRTPSIRIYVHLYTTGWICAHVKIVFFERWVPAESLCTDTIFVGALCEFRLYLQATPFLNHYFPICSNIWPVQED